MRTTLDIDEDVLSAAKELSKRTQKSTGHILSQLARETLTRPTIPTIRKVRSFHGFKTLPPAPGVIVTNEIVNKLREQEEI